MQGYNQRLDNRSKEGGALQAAYLEKASKRNAGFLQRIMGEHVPSFRKVQEAREKLGNSKVRAPESGAGKQSYRESHGISLGEATANSTSGKSPRAIEETRLSESPAIPATQEFQNMETINHRWHLADQSLSQKKVEISSADLEDSANLALNHPDVQAKQNIVIAPQTEMKLYERWEQQQRYRDAAGQKSPADLQVKYLEGALQSAKAPSPKSKSSHLQPSSPPIKEFGAQQHYVDRYFESSQSGILQANILEEALHKQPSPKRKWLKNLPASVNSLRLSSSSMSQKQKVEESLAQSRSLSNRECVPKEAN